MPGLPFGFLKFFLFSKSIQLNLYLQCVTVFTVTYSSITITQLDLMFSSCNLLHVWSSPPRYKNYIMLQTFVWTRPPCFSITWRQLFRLEGTTEFSSGLSSPLVPPWRFWDTAVITNHNFICLFTGFQSILLLYVSWNEQKDWRPAIRLMQK